MTGSSLISNSFETLWLFLLSTRDGDQKLIDSVYEDKNEMGLIKNEAATVFTAFRLSVYEDFSKRKKADTVAICSLSWPSFELSQAPMTVIVRMQE